MNDTEAAARATGLTSRLGDGVRARRAGETKTHPLDLIVDFAVCDDTEIL